ncbi:splicing factor CC1-like protein [Obelidium mucronatum]|nr:splicing factor CC1-like protein [Obelidium mucronatum]
MQLAARVRPRDIEDFFELGEYKLKVKDVRLVTDRNTRKSKGVGYVEFKEKQSVTKAIAMSGTKLLGIPMIIQHTESEKNRIAEEAARAAAELAAASSTSATAITVAATGGPAANALSRIYVGSLDFTLTEDDIRSLFEIHGPIDFVNLHKDSETGRSKGFAFVQFKRAENAKQALEKMHGYELKGRQLKVGYSTEADKSGLAYNATVGLANALAAKGEIGCCPSQLKPVPALMANLARRDDPSAPSVAVPVVAKLEVSATRCVLLKNMFDPTQETEPDWDTEIRQDVKEECGKYGKIVHIAVDKNSQGFIYIKFDAIPFAQQAINALNGRFFAGKQISATFMLDVVYHAKYPEAAYL